MRTSQYTPSLYPLLLRTVRAAPLLGFGGAIGAALYAAGHGFLAAAAGTLARALAATHPMDAGSTGRPFFGVGGWGAGSNGLLWLAVCGLFAAIAKLVGGALAAWAESRIAADVAARVRLATLDDVLARTTTSRGPTEHRLAALTTHVYEVERGIAQGVLAEIRAIVQLVPLGVLLVLLAPKLATTALLALSAFGVLAFGLRRAFKRAHARATASTGALVQAADQAVRHAELWATYGAKNRIRAHLARMGRAIADESIRIRVRASLLSSTSEVLGAAALVLALLLVSKGVFGIGQGTVLPFAITFFMAYRPLRDLVDARLVRSRGEEALLASAAHRRARPSDHAEPPGVKSWALSELVLDGVRTLHGEHGPLSLRVPPGAVVVVIGPTGVGKTSLLRAMLGLDPLCEGRISHGGTSLDGAAVGPNHRPFAWVPQDAPVVADTLIRNITLGSRDNAELDASALLADLGASELPRAFGDAVLMTERAPSGGERQWIAVARALATGLPVLLLDEPTSALDPASQGRILDAIARLRGKRTVILVTHRPEPLALADMVVRLGSSNGDHIEGGTRAHIDGLRPEQIAVEDVGAAILREVERERRRERVDARTQQRSS